MNFLKYSFITLLSIVLIGSTGYLLASSGIESKPGYAKLTMPSWFLTDTKIAINLGPKCLKPVRWMINRIVHDHELELSEQLLLSMLQDLQGVQLRVYEVENNRQVFDQAIDESVATLKQKDWQTILRVREDGEHVVIMKSGNDDSISGVSVLASTPENAVFINLMGHIDPESIAIIATSWN